MIRREKTNIIKYGAFLPHIKCKKYVLPSGKEIHVQGYETYALDELLHNYTENEVVTKRSKVPLITYEYKGKLHRYIPDILISSENKIIEVKSVWTYNLHLIRNIIKALYSRKAGYDFEFWIYDEYRNKLII